MGDLGFEPRTSGLRVRCAAVAPVTRVSGFLSYFSFAKSERILRGYRLQVDTVQGGLVAIAELSIVV
jgi:hypothetical protein